jgi:hypothetical protein
MRYSQSQYFVLKNLDQLKSKVIKAVLVRVSAKMAAMLLTRYRGRPPHRKHVLRMAEALNPKGVHAGSMSISRGGYLLDGSQRLSAQVARGVSMMWVMVLGMPDDYLGDAVAEEVPTRPRSVADYLGFYSKNRAVRSIVDAGGKDTKEVRRRASRLADLCSSLYNVMVAEKVPSHSNADRLAAYYERSIKFAFEHCYSRGLVGRAAVMHAVVLAHHRSWTQKEAGWEKALVRLIHGVWSGEELKRNTPAFTLHKYLEDIKEVRRRQKVKKSSTDNQWVIFGKVLRAVQAQVLGEYLGVLKKLRPEKTRDLIDWFSGPPDELEKAIGLVVFTYGKNGAIAPNSSAAEELMVRWDKAVKALEGAGDLDSAA